MSEAEYMEDGADYSKFMAEKMKNTKNVKIAEDGLA